MVKIHQIFAHNSLSNFMYILELENKQSFCIDPTDANLVIQKLEENDLNLNGIINTHEHFDHTSGNNELVKKYSCGVYVLEKSLDEIPQANQGLNEEDKIRLDLNSYLKVLDTPGHSPSHMCLVLYEKDIPTALFSGDTLFNAGVGNCYGGDVNNLYESVIYKIKKLPSEIAIYPGHDYMKKNLSFAANIERNNEVIPKELDKYLSARNKNKWHITTMGEERLINPFLRLNSDEIYSYLQAKNLPSSSQKDIFVSLRKLRDSW